MNSKDIHRLVQESYMNYNSIEYNSGIGSGSGTGNGDGYGLGNLGSCYSYGYGFGHGRGIGSGYGSGDGSGANSCDQDSGAGSGKGSGVGSGATTYGSKHYFVKTLGKWFEVSGTLNIEENLCYNLPDHLYHIVDRDFLNNVRNLESLRAIREKIGISTYINLLGAKVFNEQIDNQGNQMKLYEYRDRGWRFILLEVICPSTGRMYHMYPPNQRATDCFTAKASTFGNKPIALRHGDVGLVKVGETYTIPFSET